MSRIGKNPIKLPENVKVTIEGLNVNVKGPKGELSHSMYRGISASVDNGNILVSKGDRNDLSPFWGLERALIANMVLGVSEGFLKDLEMVGIGYRAKVEGNKLVLLAGYSHPVEKTIPEGLTVEITDDIKIKVIGCDKQAVGQFAALIRKVRPPEPYKGKGIKYKDEVIRKKAGKAGKAGVGGAG